ncbi:MAG: Ig-like domain-containing protein [Patescibacteria group bacterium]
MSARKRLPALIAGLLAVLLTAIPLTGYSAGTVWSIGVQDDSKGEFAGTPGTFTIGTSPVSAFPARLSGGGTTETIVFNLDSVSGDYYLNVVASDSAQNSTSGMQAVINDVKLTPRWAGSWEFKQWGNGGKNQGVQTLRWAIPASALIVGSNTLKLVVCGAPNAGPGSQPDGVTPYFDMDYVSFENAAVNFALPKRFVGSTDYWTDDALIARMKINASAFAGGKIWIDYLLENGILDHDMEIVEEMHWTACYPDLTWECVEPAHLVWDEAVWRFYRYTYEQLRAHGVKRILVKLQYTPRWASTMPNDPNYDAYPPTSDSYWVEFIREVALRLGDVVDDYAIMNEVNGSGFWSGTQEEYYRLERLAYDTLKQYDTIDADGDGTACFVAPSASNEPGQTSLWQDWYAALYPKMDCFHTHDYKWGIKPAADTIQAIDPSLQYVISETGPANWFIDQAAVPEYNPAAMASAVGYLLKDPTSPVDFLTQWMLRGDPDKDCPWPDPNEWYNSEPDPYGNNDGYCDNYNTGLINIEPPGPPYSNYTLTSSGAYLQHWCWVLDMNGNQVPVEMVGNGDWQYEVDAVNLGDRIEVIVTNFQGGYIPAPQNITFRLATPWANVKVDTYDPDDFKGTQTMAGPTVTITANNLALNSMRYVLSNASAPQNAIPGVFITSPAKSATVSGNVVIAANAYDDGAIANVAYRIDPINAGAFTSMTLSDGSYTATWNSTGVADGIHTIQVQVTDGTGKINDCCYVVKVANGGGDTEPPTAPTNLTATAVSSSQIDLSWTASTDNVGVAGYQVFRGGEQVGTSTTTTFSDTGLSPGTTYSYYVKAYDAAGNVSPQSNTAQATTQPGGGSSMHVHDIWTCTSKGTPQTAFTAGDTVYWRVKIVDAGGVAVANALVTTVMKRPDGTTYTTVTKTTGTDGVAVFSKKTARTDPKGTWTIAVTDVVLSGWTYDPAANLETEITFTLQ